MGDFYILLAYHSIVQGGINPHMPQQTLHLLYGHTFVDSRSG